MGRDLAAAAGAAWSRSPGRASGWPAGRSTATEGVRIVIEEMRKGIDKVGGDNRVGKPVRGATGDATGQAGAGPHQAWRGGPSVAAGAGRRQRM